MCCFEVGVAHCDLALVWLVRDFAVFCGEGFGSAIIERADRNDGKARVDLDARSRLACRGAQEGLFEIGMRDAFGRADEACAELDARRAHFQIRSEEHTSELQSLMRISYAVFCLKKKKKK